MIYIRMTGGAWKTLLTNSLVFHGIKYRDDAKLLDTARELRQRVCDWLTARGIAWHPDFSKGTAIYVRSVPAGSGSETLVEVIRDCRDITIADLRDENPWANDQEPAEQPSFDMAKEMYAHVPALNRMAGIGVDMTDPCSPEFNTGGVRVRVHLRDIFRYGVAVAAERLVNACLEDDFKRGFRNAGIPESTFDGFVDSEVIREPGESPRLRCIHEPKTPNGDKSTAEGPGTPTSKGSQ